jgi:hypothetical protein
LESGRELDLFELLRRLLDEFTLSFDKDFLDLLFFESLSLLFYLFLEIMAVFTTFYLLLPYFFPYLDLLRDFGFDLFEALLFLLFWAGFVLDFCEILLDYFCSTFWLWLLLLSDLKLIFDELCPERVL